MKKLLLFLVFVCSIVIINAQTFSFMHTKDLFTQEPISFDNEITIICAEDDSPVTDYFIFENLTSSAVAFKLRLVEIEAADNSSVSMCFGGECSNETISGVLNVEAESMYQEFDLQYKFNDFPFATVRIEFLNDQTEEVFQSFTVKYRSNTSLGNKPNSVIDLNMKASVNPASSHTVVNYSVPAKYTNAKLVLCSTFGNKIQQYPIKTGVENGKVNIDVSTLNNGIYFYSIVAGNKTLITKKLIVKH